GAARQLLEHVGHDSARGEIGHFDRGVDSYQQRHRLAPAVKALNLQGSLCARAECPVQREIETLRAVEPECARTDPFLELAWQDPHADEVRAMDALESARDDRADAKQARALGGPVARAA